MQIFDFNHNLKVWFDKPFIISESDISYYQFSILANQTIEMLSKNGIESGEKVAILSETNETYLLLIFAMFQMGAIVVPINKKLPGKQINEMLKGINCTKLIVDDPNFNRIYSNLNTRLWATLIFRHSDLITVNTPYLLEQLLHLGADPRRIELLPMGVDTSFFFPKKNHYKKQNLQLLSVGRLVKWKTYDLGIQAVGELVREGIDLKYYIIGDGSERDDLQRLIEKLI